MKNLFRLLLIFLPLYAMASIDVGNWRVSSYDIKTKTAVLGKYLGSSTSVTVPNGITINVFDSSDNKYKDIYFNTKLGGNLFKDNKTVVSVSLGNHPSIPSFCFDGCDSLNSVSSDVALSSVGECAFRWCGSLVSIPSLESVILIEDSAFDGCSSLNTMMSLKSVITIKYRAFRNCSSLTGILELPSATTIESEAFLGCSSLTSVMIDNISSMGNCVFKGCSAIEDAKIVGNADIKGGIFRNCLNLRNVEFAGNIRFGDFKVVSGIFGSTTRDISPFEGCTSLEKVILGCLFETIPYSTFKDLSSLKEVTVDCELKNIESRAFSGCGALVSLSSFEAVTNIGENAFSGCFSLSGAVELPNAENVGKRAFSGCLGIKGVDFSGNLTSIGSEAFYGCTSLKSIRTSPSLKTLGESAFRNCAALETVEINGRNLDLSLSKFIFNGCNSLRKVFFGDGIMALPTGIDKYDGPFVCCTALEEVIVGSGVSEIPVSFLNANRSTESPRPGKVIFSGNITRVGGRSLSVSTLTNLTINLADGCIVDYSAFSGCPGVNSESIDFTKIVSIGSDAFRGCISLESVVAHNLKELGSSVFKGCSGLESVSLKGDALIKQCAFGACSSLRRIEILGNVGFSSTNYGDDSYMPFDDSNSIEEVVLGEGVSFIPASLFWNKGFLTNVTVTSSLTNVYDKAFSGCKSLKSLKGAGSVTGIGGSAFSGCSSLESFEGFSAVTNIGSSAFSGCSSLTGKVDLVNLKTVESSIFKNCKKLRQVKFGKDLEFVHADAFSGSTNLIAFTFEGLPPEADDNAFRNVKKGALGIYPTSTLEFDDAEDKLRSVQTLSETPEKKEWCDVIADDGTWKKLLMAANKPILTNDVYDVKAGSLQLNWENEKAPMPSAKEYGITYEIRRGFTDNYETADILTNGYDQLQYVDKQFDFTGGVSRIWYWVTPEHECTNLFERSDSCRTKNRYGVCVGFNKFRNGEEIRKEATYKEASLFFRLAKERSGFDMNFLFDENATDENTISTMEAYLQKIRPGDIFLFFISTHGHTGNKNNKPSLKMYNSVNATDAARLDYDELSRCVKLFITHECRFVGVIQACHSQSMVMRGVVAKENEVAENMMQCVGDSGSCSQLSAWITSARINEKATKYSFDTMSLFSEYFVGNAWRDYYADIDLYINGELIKREYHNDCVIDFRELAEYVKMMYVRGEKMNGKIYTSNAVCYNTNLMSRICVEVVPADNVYEYNGEYLSPPHRIESIVDFKNKNETARCFSWDEVRGATRYRLYKTFSNLEHLIPVHINLPYAKHTENDVFIMKNYEGESDKTECNTTIKCLYYVQSVNPAGIGTFSAPHQVYNIVPTDYERDFVNYLTQQGLDASSYDMDDLYRAANAVLVEGAQPLASCFLTGSDPFDPNSQFTANITMANGKPKVTPNPDLGDKRRYTIYGKKDLSSQSVDWSDMSTVPELEKSEYRFFKVDVSLP